MKPLVSVVVPTYNRAPDLDRALRSVIAQTDARWEAIVVDNNSIDDTDDVIQSLAEPRIKLLKINNRGVIAASRNLGIRHAEGEYIAFLDSDDWWMPRKLEESLLYLEEGADVVYHELLVAKKLGQRVLWRSGCVRHLKRPVFEDLLLGGNALLNSSAVVRKSILKASGGLSEDVAWITMEDYEAWLKIAKVTERFRLIPKTLGYNWAGGGNVSNPMQTIKNLDAFEEHYADDISQLSSKAGLWWLNYSRGRAYYRMENYAMAESVLRKLRWRQVPFQVSLKKIWMNLIIKLFHRSNNRLEGT